MGNTATPSVDDGRAVPAPLGSDGVRFPLRAAAIDAGSNAIRMMAVEFLQPDRFDVLEQIRAPVRLGHEAFQSGRLARSAMDAAVDVFASFRERLDALGVVHYRAVATSAVRESRNGAAFVERIQAACGIELEPITGAEEARLVHRAVRSRIPLGHENWVLVDLGGGSVEVSLADAGGVRWSVSEGMGSVRLLEELEVAGDNPKRFRRRLEEYISTLRMPGREADPAGFIATGGNIEALAKLADARDDETQVSRLTRDTLNALIEKLAERSIEERIADFGMRPDRADVILPAAMVYERLCARAGFDEILVPHVGVKEGVVLDVVDDLTEHASHTRRHDEIVWGGALALGRRYDFDEAHARQVTTLALSLFDQLERMHGLSIADRRVLVAAALLHDVGAFIAYKRHHKHSLYVIANSELPGLTPAEILMAANVARYHRKGLPTDRHEAYAQLPSEQRTRVRRLAALLRIADGLDREHAQRVTDVRAGIERDRLTLDLGGQGELTLERWAAQKKADLFEAEFGLDVELADGAGA